MKCNNKYCMWNMFNQCCPEDETSYLLAIPDTLDCPSSLRFDHQTQLYILADECRGMLQHKNMKELIEIKNFIENQREL